MKDNFCVSLDSDEELVNKFLLMLKIWELTMHHQQ